MVKKVRTPIAAPLLAGMVAIMLLRFTPVWSFLFHYRTILNIFSIISLILHGALCGVLFAKKRDEILLVVIGCHTLYGLYWLFRYFSLNNVLYFAAYALLLVLALALGEQTLIKADLSQIKALAGNLFFLPAALYLVCILLSFIDSLPAQTELMYLLPGLIIDLLNAAALLTLAMWLKDPYTYIDATEVTGTYTGATYDASYNETYTGATYTQTYDDAYCSLAKHIILCLFTCGIWYLIWTYRTTKYLNKAPYVTQENPTTQLLLCMFVPFYQIFWFYKQGQRIDAMSKQKNLGTSDMATICLLLGIFIPLIACILMQDRINTLCTTKETV